MILKELIATLDEYEHIEIWVHKKGNHLFSGVVKEFTARYYYEILSERVVSKVYTDSHSLGPWLVIYVNDASVYANDWLGL